MAETLIVIFILGITMTVLMSLVVSAYRNYRYNFEQAIAIEEGRRAMEKLVKEISEASYGDDGSYPFVQAVDYTVTFYSNIDHTAATERVRYFLVGTTLKKGVVEPTGDPPQYVQSNEVVTEIFSFVQNGSTTPIFTYYNGDWPVDTTNNPLSTFTRLSDTKLMNVHILINVNPIGPIGNFDLKSDTQLRNLKTNL